MINVYKLSNRAPDQKLMLNGYFSHDIRKGQKGCTLAFWPESLKKEIIDTDLCRDQYFIQFPFKSRAIVGESKLKPDYAHSCQI